MCKAASRDATVERTTKEPVSPMNAWIGIDVAKQTLSVCILTEESKARQRTVTNTASGFRALLVFVERHVPGTLGANRHFCLEATGAYSQPVALFLSEQGERVSVINPYRAKHHGLAQGPSNKTDPADARLLADYCRKENPPLWRAAAPEVRLLVALLRRLESVKEHLVQEGNRQKEPGLPKEIQRSLATMVRHLEKEKVRLEGQIKDHIHRHPDLQRDQELLTSIPGIGDVTAWWILAELPDVELFDSAQQAAAFAGLNPREFRSGTSVHRKTRLSKAGNAFLRKALYLPAMAAQRFNPLIAAFAHRMLQAGKASMVVLGACMRKLLLIAFGVLKHQQPFSPNGFQPAA